MPELEIKTDILAPRHQKTIEYSGDYPSRLFKVIPPLMKDIFKITSSNFFEDKIKWDTSGEPTEFFGQWRGRDGKDRRTDVWVIVKVQGKQSPTEKKGSAVITIRGIIETSFPYSNLIDKSLVKTYSYFFYDKQRRYYIEEARRRFDILENEIKKELEIMGG